MAGSLVQNVLEKWGKRRMQKSVGLVTSHPTACPGNFPIPWSNRFHLYQLVLQPREDKCQVPPEVLRAVGVASQPWALGQEARLGDGMAGAGLCAGAHFCLELPLNSVF